MYDSQVIAHRLIILRRCVAALALVAACGSGPKDGGSESDGDSDGATSADTSATGMTTGAAGTGGDSETGVIEPPAGCPAFTFPEFEGPYGQVYCEVYIGCFGEVGGREPGDPTATTIPDCLELTCGNGDVALTGEDECTYDAELGAQCLSELGAIAEDLAGQCPAIDDAWFPDACGLAIGCASP